jgi:DNA invertase Pin-like site-specific DNA recombinase
MPIPPVSGLASLLSDEELKREMSRRHLERMRAGYRAKQANGGYLGGVTPYGWQSDGQGGLIPHAAEQHVIAVARTMRHLGASYRLISEYFVASGVRLRRGKQWHPQTVKDVLQRAARLGSTPG